MTGMNVIAVHHGIVHAEEKYLREVFGREDSKFFNRMRQQVR